MNGRGWSRVVLATTAALFLSACGSARRGEPIRGPLSLDEKAVRGRNVFMRNCHSCHPGGEGGLAPAINNKPAPTFLKHIQVRHGLGAMPSFSHEEIGDAELDDLLHYLKVLKKQ
jgi:mono/diheme cytochrome c family protein